MNLQQLKKIAAFYTRFTLSFTQVGYRARQLTWPAYKADFSGQNWVVTGASAGLGKHIALAAAKAGARVTAVARRSAKLDGLVREAAALGITGIETSDCDFSLQADSARWVRERIASGQRVDVLVNNVGVLNDDHMLTAEGREASYVINLLSHYLITEELIRAGTLGGPKPLVINMTSGGGYNVPLSTGMLNTTNPAKFNGTAAYAFHKRAQMVLNQYWRDTYGSRGIGFYVMHPGWADTDGVKRSMPRFRKILQLILRDAESGADTALWLAATRPSQPEQELVWFDRKVRTAHVYPRTQATKDTPQTLAAFLERDLTSLSGAAGG
jgi:dehydrogenase/reductase SDR family protein 12